MKSDMQLQRDVLDELKWDPAVNAAQIRVEVKDGLVTLAGRVESFAEKWAAEWAAKRVSGVKALAVEISVEPTRFRELTDADIARAAENALKWHAHAPQDRIKVTVEKGRITLEGEGDRTPSRAPLSGGHGCQQPDRPQTEGGANPGQGKDRSSFPTQRGC
jgi:osmotically-inducible protein OsmY